jgi:arsenate reductase
MAEAFLNKLARERFKAESAGLEPTAVNPLAVKVMREVGIDIRGKKSQSVFDLFKRGNFYGHVITVCDEASAEQCPIFPGSVKYHHWSFPDPSKFQGTQEEQLKHFRIIRDEIESKVREFIGSFENSGN